MDKATQPPPIDRGIMEDLTLDNPDGILDIADRGTGTLDTAAEKREYLTRLIKQIETRIEKIKTGLIYPDPGYSPAAIQVCLHQLRLRLKELAPGRITPRNYWTFPDRDKLTTLVNTLTELEIILGRESDTAADFFSGLPIKDKLKYKRSLPHFIYLFSCLDESHHIQGLQQNAAFKHCLSALDYKGKTDILSSDTARKYRERYNNKHNPPGKAAEKEVSSILTRLNQIKE